MSVCDIKLSKHLIDFDLVLSVQDIRAMLTYASLYEALRAARHVTPCKISLQWAWFGFKMTTEAATMLYDNVFDCFASVESILFNNNEILQSVCTL